LMEICLEHGSCAFNGWAIGDVEVAVTMMVRIRMFVLL
jgi:hypothetical protein